MKTVQEILRDSKTCTIAKLVNATKNYQDYEFVKNHYEKQIKQDIENAKIYNDGLLTDGFDVAINKLKLYRELLQAKNKSFLFFGFAGY